MPLALAAAFYFSKGSSSSFLSMIVFDDLNFYIYSIAAVNSALETALVIRLEARRESCAAPPTFSALVADILPPGPLLAAPDLPYYVVLRVWLEPGCSESLSSVPYGFIGLSMSLSMSFGSMGKLIIF